MLDTLAPSNGGRLIKRTETEGSSGTFVCQARVLLQKVCAESLLQAFLSMTDSPLLVVVPKMVLITET